jgi:hypothetical protein
VECVTQYTERSYITWEDRQEMFFSLEFTLLSYL